jgi:hypothetical protein
MAKREVPPAPDEQDRPMSDGKVPMPADGHDSSKIRPDRVGDADTHGRGRGGESGGGSYDNPHAGKEPHGFEGGQSVRGYFGPGQLDGEKADPGQAGIVGQGGDTVETVGGSGDSERAGAPGTTPVHKPSLVTAGGRTFEVVQESGVAEAEVNGKVATDAAYEEEQESPGSG